MNDFLEHIKPLSYRAKIALPLLYAEHVLWTYSFSEAQTSSLRRPLDLAWTWLEDQSVQAHDIYLEIQPLHEVTQELEDDGALEAVLATISALYYGAWKADGYDFTDLKRDNRSLYGGDFFEISSKTALEAQELAARAAANQAAELRWQEQTLNTLLETHRAADPGQLGPPLHREVLLRD
jgi:hypothetical protein